MAVRDDFAAGEVLAAADLNDTFASKLDQSTGYAYNSTVYFTSSGSFTKATYPWLRAIRVKCQGGGGGSGGGATTTAGQNAIGGNAGGGCYAESFITDIAGLSASVTVTVGAGGAAGTGGGNGAAGGTSSFGALVSANGGDEGVFGTSVATGGATGAFQGSADGGQTGTGDLVIPGGSSGLTIYYTNSNPLIIPGGSSFLADPAPVRNTSGNGIAGQPYGGGATAGGNAQSQATQRDGAAGGAGIVIVELFA